VVFASGEEILEFAAETSLSLSGGAEILELSVEFRVLDQS